MGKTLTDDIEALQKQFEEALQKIQYETWTPQSQQQWTQEWLGKKSPFSDIEQAFQRLPLHEKQKQGKSFYEAKNQFKTLVIQKLEEVEQNWETWKMSQEHVDLTLPLPSPLPMQASLHPVFVVQERVMQTLKSLGFTICEAPELDHDDYNFRLLNFPDGHSARDMQDSFVIGSNWYLRTHTSNCQVHALRKFGAPLAIASPGRVFRAEADATHLPMFHQIECLMVDEGIHIGHMRYIIETFLSRLFHTEIKTRFRPSYFPFTEPSIELDMTCHQCLGKGCRLCKQTGWLEIGGCGQVHPNVLSFNGVDPSKMTGFAFGFGLERLTMLLFKIQDIRDLYNGDLNYLNSFKLWDLV